MKVGRKKLRQIILEVLCEGEIIYPNFPDHRDDTDEKWDDLLDPDEYEELRSLRDQLRMLRGKEDQILRDIMSQTKEDDKKYPEDDEEFERYLAGIKSSKSGKSGQLIDLFDDYDDDTMSELADPGVHGGPSALQVPYGDEIDADGEEEDVDESTSDAKRAYIQTLQDKLVADTSSANKGDRLARDRMRSDQAALNTKGDGYVA